MSARVHSAKPASETTDRPMVDTDGAGLEVLSAAECLRLLAQTDRGRIALNVGALPAILPVRFVLDGGRVVLCARSGTVLDRATNENVVAFQTDGVASAVEWSVSVIGFARHLSSPHDVARAASLPLRRWSASAPHRFVAISADYVTGRRTV